MKLLRLELLDYDSMLYTWKVLQDGLILASGVEYSEEEAYKKGTEELGKLIKKS